MKLISGSVICAILAFCFLSGSVKSLPTGLLHPVTDVVDSLAKVPAVVGNIAGTATGAVGNTVKGTVDAATGAVNTMVKGTVNAATGAVATWVAGTTNALTGTVGSLTNVVGGASIL